jgi:hypothetical protein
MSSSTRLQITFMGETRHSAVIERTLNPSWYETLSIPVCLPALHYAPEVAIGIYDKDAFTEGECFGWWVLWESFLLSECMVSSCQLCYLSSSLLEGGVCRRASGEG